MGVNFNPILTPEESLPLSPFQDKSPWLERPDEGELSVDVFEQGGSVVIKATIAGIKPQDLDIFIENDMVTIRGKRCDDDNPRNKNFFLQECYWGSFSRTVILPVHIKGDEARALLKGGVLKIIIPTSQKNSQIKIEEIPEEV
jgi:HSP20 family protein